MLLDTEMDQLFEDLQDRVHVFPGNIASFLSIIVPSYALDPPRRVSQRAFSKYTPPKGKKVKGYAGLVRLPLVPYREAA